MSKKRKRPSDNEILILYNEVDGICPLCSKVLLYEKNSSKHKNFEIAHIYPLNPTDEEKEILKNEEILNADVNNLDNLIALCPECHTKFDKPRTVEEYRHLVNIKKKISRIQENRSYYHQYQIEEEILSILINLSELDDDKVSLMKLNYKALKIDDKTDNTITGITKRRIKYDVTNYFLYIKEQFLNIEKLKPGTFNLISSQIKTYYLKILRVEKNQEEIFNNMSEWLYKKSNSKSVEACKIIISFFIQNCEVFSW